MKQPLLRRQDQRHLEVARHLAWGQHVSDVDWDNAAAIILNQVRRCEGMMMNEKKNILVCTFWLQQLQVTLLVIATGY